MVYQDDFILSIREQKELKARNNQAIEDSIVDYALYHGANFKILSWTEIGFFVFAGIFLYAAIIAE